MKPFRLGLFVVATLAILAGGIFLIGSKQLSFRSTYRLKTEFENVGGLQEGAEVRVGGMHEGTIKRIDLPTSPDGKVTVVMDLASRTRDVVKSDSTAAIASEGLVGDKYIEVSFGSTGGSERNFDVLIAHQPFRCDRRSGIGFDDIAGAAGEIHHDSHLSIGAGRQIDSLDGALVHTTHAHLGPFLQTTHIFKFGFQAIGGTEAQLFAADQKDAPRQNRQRGHNEEA